MHGIQYVCQTWNNHDLTALSLFRKFMVATTQLKYFSKNKNWRQHCSSKDYCGGLRQQALMIISISLKYLTLCGYLKQSWINTTSPKYNSCNRKIIRILSWCSEAVSQTCSVKEVFLEIHKIHRKKPVPESLKKRSWHRCFPVNFVKFLRTSFLKEHLRWLLLDVAMLLPWHSPPTQNYQFLSVLILWIIREYWNITIKIMHFGVICSFVVNVFLSWVGGWVDLYVQRYVTVHY